VKNIDWIPELINQIPNVISHIVYGYAFLSAFYWSSFKDNKDFNNLIIKSITINYMLVTIYNMVIEKYEITFKLNYSKIISFFIISALLGIIIGQIITHRWFNIFLNKIHIGRTTNENIWDDIIKPHTWVRGFMKDGSSYLGQYRYGEPFKSEPIIALTNYQKLDKDSDVVIDQSQNKNELILLNTKDFEKIEITYSEKIKLMDKIWYWLTGNT